MAEPSYTLKLTLAEANLVREALKTQHSQDMNYRRAPDESPEFPPDKEARHQRILNAEQLLRRIG